MNAIEVIFSLQTASFACSGEAGALCVYFPSHVWKKATRSIPERRSFFLFFLHWQSDNNIIFIPLK